MNDPTFYIANDAGGAVPGFWQPVRLLCKEGGNIGRVKIERIRSRQLNQYWTGSTQVAELPLIENDEELIKLLTAHSNRWFDTSKRFTFDKVELTTGKYFPRIYRPQIQGALSGSHFKNSLYRRISTGEPYSYLPFDHRALLSSILQLETLISRLRTVFLTVYPSAPNMQLFGHEIRNILILAATEAESQMKAILVSNKCEPKKGFYRTEDYFKLVDALKLKEYAIGFPWYPDIGQCSPFRDWTLDQPTQSLHWYSAYNAVKHDRETKLSEGNLWNVILAVAAVCILLLAQYGDNIPHWNEIIGSFFEVPAAPTWSLNECYLPPVKGCEWFEAPFSF